MRLREGPSPHEVPRRSVIVGLISTTALSACGTALSACGTGANGPLPSARSSASGPDFAAAVDRLEHRYGAEVGVFALDTGTERTLDHRADQRFMMCSTFKAALVGAVLLKSQNEPGLLDRSIVVPLGSEVEAGYAPFGISRLGKTATFAELCAAAVQISDNIAANLLIDLVGGPSAVTSFFRSLGDDVTRLDRYEETMSDGDAKDLLDTTTPRASATTLQHLVLGDVLGEHQRKQLTDWLLSATTGIDCIRAGLPSDWKVADKTGTGSHGDRNDIAVVWPDGDRAPLVLAVLTHTPPPAERKDQLIADVARAAAAALAL